MSTAIRVGELARRTQCPVETIRYYERIGLFPSPRRSAGNYRLYGEPHVERLVFIRHCRSLDLSVAEIRALLKLRDAPAKSCCDVNAVVDTHIGQVTRRIRELQGLRGQLRDLRAQCGDGRAVKDCRILDQLSRRGSTVEPIRHAAVRHTVATKSQRRASRRSLSV